MQSIRFHFFFFHYFFLSFLLTALSPSLSLLLLFSLFLPQSLSKNDLVVLWGGTKDGKLLQWEIPLPLSSKTVTTPTHVLPTPHRSVSCLLYLHPAQLVSIGVPSNELVIWDTKKATLLYNILLSHLSPSLGVVGVGCLSVVENDNSKSNSRLMSSLSPRASPLKNRPSKKNTKTTTNKNLLVLKQEEGPKSDGVSCRLVTGGEGEMLVSECVVPFEVPSLKDSSSWLSS